LSDFSAIALTSGTLAAASAVIVGLISMRRFYRGLCWE